MCRRLVGGSGTGGCRRYARLTPSSWGAAEDAAARLGARLVSLETPAEPAFVFSQPELFASPSIIGLRALTTEITGTPRFSWVSVQSPTYTDWGNPLFNGFTFGYARLFDGAPKWEASPYGQLIGGGSGCDHRADRVPVRPGRGADVAGLLHIHERVLCRGGRHQLLGIDDLGGLL